jgi:hypothetical protein
VNYVDTINVNRDGSGSFNGENAVKVYVLTNLACCLKIELACPEVRRVLSALKAAKLITGLNSPKRQVHLERVLIMLEQAKTQVVYLEAS